MTTHNKLREFDIKKKSMELRNDMIFLRDRDKSSRNLQEELNSEKYKTNNSSDYDNIEIIDNNNQNSIFYNNNNKQNIQKKSITKMIKNLINNYYQQNMN